MLTLRGITASNKCSFILVHHSFKEKKLKSAPEHMFGARAIEEQCDYAFMFSTDVATIVKNRLGLIRESTVLIDDDTSKLIK